MNSRQEENQTPSGASCATYRKVVNKLAKILRIDPSHTKYPREDFDSLIDLVDEKSKSRALEWYRRGIKRGFVCATDQIIEKTLEFKNNTLYSPPEIKITVRLKFKGENSKNEEFSFTAEELGFD